jgi:type IV pilus assembly protein PilY1
VIFITTIPNSSACSAGGESVLMEVDAASGSRLSEAQFDITNDGIINEEDMIEIDNPEYDPDDPTQQSDDPDAPNYVPEKIQVAPTGIWFPTMLYPPSILGIEREEIKLMSTAAGGIVDVRETAEKKGVVYWLQLNN